MHSRFFLELRLIYKCRHGDRLLQFVCSFRHRYSQSQHIPEVVHVVHTIVINMKFTLILLFFALFAVICSSTEVPSKGSLDEDLPTGLSKEELPIVRKDDDVPAVDSDGELSLSDDLAVTSRSSICHRWCKYCKKAKKHRKYCKYCLLCWRKCRWKKCLFCYRRYCLK